MDQEDGHPVGKLSRVSLEMGLRPADLVPSMFRMEPFAVIEDRYRNEDGPWLLETDGGFWYRIVFRQVAGRWGHFQEFFDGPGDPRKLGL